jgi:RNA polymerase sigma-70 factor (ECF subfamily)
MYQRDNAADEFIAILCRARDGDERAFEEVVRRKSKDMLFFAMSLLSDKDSAEDAVQESVIQMWRGIGKLQKPESFDAWMYQIIKRSVYKLYKKHPMTELNFADAAELPDAALVEEDEEFIPDKYTENKDRERQIYDIVKSIPRGRRDVVLMHYYADLSITEIADALGQSASTVRGILAKARKDIKTKVQQLEVLGVAMVPAGGNLGRILRDMADELVSGDAMDSVITHAHIAALSAAPLALNAKKILAMTAGGLTATALAITGLFFVDSYNAEQPPEPVAPVTSEVIEPVNDVPDISRDGSIFLAGDSETGYFNPREAIFVDDAVPDGIVSYAVTTADGETVLTGAGKDAAADLIKMRERGMNGAYYLRYTADYGGGYVLHTYRNFAIDDAV